MKDSSIKTRIFWMAGTTIVLFLSFVLCRYVFFSLHGNRGWAVLMLIIALAVTGISAIFDSRKIMSCTAVGYIGGFALGMIFNVSGVDPGGGATSNWWVIWAASFLVIVAIGVLWEIIGRSSRIILTA